jgi:hypothetical protein
MCNLYSTTTNQAAIAALFRVVNRYVGNLAPMPGVFPDYPAPVVRNTETGRELSMMRWGMPPPLRTGGPPVTNIRNTSSFECRSRDLHRAGCHRGRSDADGLIVDRQRHTPRRRPRCSDQDRGVQRKLVRREDVDASIS